jgi:hypothetical protein
VKAEPISDLGASAAHTSAQAWAALWLVIAIALLWPAAINGGAFWFPDTSSYIRGADAAFVTATGSPSDWSDRIVLSTSSAEDGVANEGSAKRASGPYPVNGKMVISGRSIYYGFLIYLPIRFAGPWAAIAIQAALIAGGLTLFLAVATRAMTQRRIFVASVAAATLVVLTPMAFYTCMLMPDIWSGMAAAMIALIAAMRVQMRKVEIAVAWALAAAAASFHSSHILIALGVGVAALALAPNWRGRGAGFVAGIAAAGMGLATSAIFSTTVEAQLGQKPISPPFLSARLTSSGPGMTFLDNHCSKALRDKRFALCEVLDQLPRPSDEFLWSEQRDSGVFQLAAKPLQRRIAAEDKQFYLAVIAHDPLAYVGSFVAATAETLTSFNMINFNYSDLRRTGIARNLPEPVAQDALASRAVANTMPTGFTLWATVAISLLSLIIVLAGLWREVRAGRGLGRRSQRLALLLIAGLLANAVICGALSKPDARYQMRLEWLLPLAAACTMIGWQSPVRGTATKARRLG